MSRGLAPSLRAGVDALITQPGLLVQIGFQPTLHLTSRAMASWHGANWLPWQMKLSGLGADGSSSTQQGSLTLGNTRLEIGVLILEQGIADRPINIWSFYGDVPVDPDVVQIFGGVGDNSSIDPTSGLCQITLRPESGVTLYSPRQYMTKEQGWNHLPAPGSAITWGRTTITLKTEGI
jgi:hypothetical protein